MSSLADETDQTMSRRDVLRVAGAAVSGVVVSRGLGVQQNLVLAQAGKQGKRVIVVGAGIGGLCCAYELMDRGHDVMVLEASGRTGGHVKTVHDPLPDGLYADVGAEHFTKPGYDQFWKYVDKFKLAALPYPRRLNMLRRTRRCPKYLAAEHACSAFLSRSDRATFVGQF